MNKERYVRRLSRKGQYCGCQHVYYATRVGDQNIDCKELFKCIKILINIKDGRAWMVDVNTSVNLWNPYDYFTRLKAILYFNSFKYRFERFFLKILGFQNFKQRYIDQFRYDLIGSDPDALLSILEFYFNVEDNSTFESADPICQRARNVFMKISRQYRNYERYDLHDVE